MSCDFALEAGDLLICHMLENFHFFHFTRNLWSIFTMGFCGELFDRGRRGTVIGDSSKLVCCFHWNQDHHQADEH